MWIIKWWQTVNYSSAEGGVVPDTLYIKQNKKFYSLYWVFFSWLMFLYWINNLHAFRHPALLNVLCVDPLHQYLAPYEEQICAPAGLLPRSLTWKHHPSIYWWLKALICHFTICHADRKEKCHVIEPAALAQHPAGRLIDAIFPVIVRPGSANDEKCRETFDIYLNWGFPAESGQVRASHERDTEGLIKNLSIFYVTRSGYIEKYGFNAQTEAELKTPYYSHFQFFYFSSSSLFFIIFFFFIFIFFD